MEAMIITVLFAVSGFIFMVNESRKRKAGQEERSVEKQGGDDKTDQHDKPHFLDFSGGTLGI